MIKVEDIYEAQQNIISLIEIQAKDGEQSKKVKQNRNDLFALGQFIDDKYRPQRGLHGTATGLRVLSNIANTRELVKGLVKYIRLRRSIEENIQGQHFDPSKIDMDDLNIIKISEVLYALSYVPRAVTGTQGLVEALSKKLLANLVNIEGESGWNYFIGEGVTIEVLPSAHAMLALSVSGYEIEVEVVYDTLCNRISKEGAPNNPSEFAEMSFALYAMCRSMKPPHKKKKSTAKFLLDKLWSSPYCTLDSNFEQNLEYWHQSSHSYVRIPWQMYLIAVASWISRLKFFTVNVQERVASFVSAVKNGGFRYEYSGPYRSTRTNAILYDCLDLISLHLPKNGWYQILIIWDSVRRFLGSKIMHWIGMALGIGIIVYSIYAWKANPQSKISDLAPEFIGAIVLTLITLGKKK